MAKSAEHETRHEAECRHCSARIVRRRFLGSDWWVHQPAGAAFMDGQHEYCHRTTAEPRDTQAGDGR